MSNANQIPAWKHGPRLYLLMLLVLAGSFLAASLGTQFNPDGILYFSYLRSAFFDQDLLFVNEFNELHLLPLSRHVSETGLEGNPVAIGMPLLMAPFYAMAFLADLLFQSAGIALGDNGYRGIYALVLPFGSLFYGCLTVWMLLKVLKKHYQDSRPALPVLHIMLGTPFLFYLAVHYHFSHLCSAFSVTLLLYGVQKIRDDFRLAKQYAPFFLLGAAGGLAVLVRTQNGLFWIIPLCFLLFRLRQDGGWRRIFLQGVCFLAGAAVTVSPQLTVWKILQGSWIHAPEAANINFSNMHLPEILISPYHGLFFWSPILIISMLGLFLLIQKDVERGFPLLVAVLLQLAVNGAMRGWWEGGSFGLRLFVNCTPIFCIGLSVAYNRVKARWLRLLGGVFVFWTFLLSLNVITEKINLNRFYPAEEIIRLQVWQLTGWFKPEEVMARLSVFYAGAQAFILTAAVILGLMIFFKVRQALPSLAENRLSPIFHTTGIALAGLGLSVLIYFMGVNSHQHKSHWQNDLQQIENGINSYQKFYIEYSFYIVHADYLSAVGRKSQAIKEYIKALRIYPTPQLYKRISDLLISCGHLQAARQVIQKARIQWPRDPRIQKQAKRLKYRLMPR